MAEQKTGSGFVRVPRTVGENEMYQSRQVEPGPIPNQTSPEEVLGTLDGAFAFVSEDRATGKAGLRSAQAGALHAVLAHWTTNSAVAALVVMPTGSGKTDTMIAIHAAERIERLIVIVPSDALRNQIGGAFETYGNLQASGVVDENALRPIVGRVAHAFSSVDEAREFATACNVIVATIPALNASTLESREALLNECSHLFVDEAHHSPANTWKQLKDEFGERKVVLFTATPFREDGLKIAGKMIYEFPLREARKAGFFTKINYVSVLDFKDPDRSVAVEAAKRLQADIDAGLDHVLMARANSVARAKHLVKLYEEIAPLLGPRVLHSKLANGPKKLALRDLAERKTRIVVCVDMLGEGFDMPELKVAAVHDAHRSLGVTLQFIGRFARSKGTTLGDATVVVARPATGLDRTLRRLHIENSDWNGIIEDLSEAAVTGQREVSEFESGFSATPEEVSISSLVPKTSAVAYKTHCANWAPENVTDVHSEEALLTYPVPVNLGERVLWFVTRNQHVVSWGDLEGIEEVDFDLRVAYWNRDLGVLYINGSDNSDSLYEDLAKALCGDDVELLKGANVYRSMARLNRLVPKNVGVLDTRNRSRRFSMHVGADVTDGFPVAEAATKTQTNIFAHGYENGESRTIGASIKGRFWSHSQALSLKHWANWCDWVGSKIVDGSISVDGVIASFILPVQLEARPDLVLLGIDWSTEMLSGTSEARTVTFPDGRQWPIIDTDLVVTDFASSGPLAFKIATPVGECSFEADFTKTGLTITAPDNEPMVTTAQSSKPLHQFLIESDLRWVFEQDALVIKGGFLLQPNRDLPSYDRASLIALDWNGTDIKRESQGAAKDTTSVQYRMLRHVETLADWQVIVDDDGSGEVADIVAVRVENGELHVLLVHCKYSHEASPGSRVVDLYEVCGQAHKSTRFRHGIDAFFQRLIRRERKRQQVHGRSGLEKGTAADLYELEERAHECPLKFTIAVAQPGLSKAVVSDQQIELLAAAEVYLAETANSDFVVWCSN